MCWELKNAYVGIICPEFERTGQRCDNPIQTNLAVVAGNCPDHDRQNASHLNTQLLVHLQRNEQTVVERGEHGQASTQQTVDPSGQHQRTPNHDYDSSRWPWDYLQNQALNSIYQDNNGVPPLGTYERSSLSLPMPTFGTGSSSINQESYMPENNAGQESYQEQDTSSNRHESISHDPAQGYSNQENVSEISYKLR
ncbi:hypothetical protein OCU04_004516 [Sclerotinia nivalis]|uniref:Uncharacterized protein n=1 Tax=Sclerotinia nivalis TaxID=352851 RepID=A0A9X0AQK2_9HELO|nr:hypothetical protein OCU04_004516 [Sclerotinia nivalis]